MMNKNYPPEVVSVSELVDRFHRRMSNLIADDLEKVFSGKGVDWHTVRIEAYIHAETILIEEWREIFDRETARILTK